MDESKQTLAGENNVNKKILKLWERKEKKAKTGLVWEAQTAIK